MTSKGKKGARQAAIPALAIRPAAPSDAAEIVKMVRALAAHVGDETQATVTVAAMAEAGSGPNPHWRGVVAEAGGKLAGMCLYSVQFSTWIGTPGLYVIDLYVQPTFRHGQLGRRLLAEAARQGRALGCRFIRLEVDHRNQSVLGFYERLGFSRRPGDAIFILKPDGFDALAKG